MPNRFMQKPQKIRLVAMSLETLCTFYVFVAYILIFVILRWAIHYYWESPLISTSQLSIEYIYV
jgi:hypothetical protein